MKRTARRASVLVALALVASAGLTTTGGVSPAHASSSRVRFVAVPGSSILVHGTYPKVESQCKSVTQPVLHARYAGTIEVGKDTDGTLFVIGELPFEDYLQGIAEVPRTWPPEALKAQVVAARAYALSRMGRPDATGERLGYQLCATDACQVYRGLGISDGPYGDLWRKAVQATDHQVLLFGGKPADTVYSSTSPGYTLGNEDVFGTDPVPYLRPIAETDDGASPLSHWQMSMPFDDLARFLREAGSWGTERISNVQLDGQDVVIKGGGRRATLGVSEFRSELDYWAHCLQPDRYPTDDVDGHLPQTVPSIWFDLSTQGRTMVLDGRGWGHAVGMVQWGAYGKAQRGLSYREILAAYYGGLKPRRYASEPGLIRIGIATGLTGLTIESTGSVQVEGRRPGPGPWRITGGKQLRVEPGMPAPVWISGSSFVRAPRSGRSGRMLHATVSVPELSVVQLLLRVEGTDLGLGSPLTVQGGRVTLEATIPEIPSGRYQLRVLTTNGIDRALSPVRTVQIHGVAPTPSPVPSPSIAPSPLSSASAATPIALPSTPAGSAVPLAVGVSLGAVAVLILAVLGFVLWRRAARRRATRRGVAGPSGGGIE